MTYFLVDLAAPGVTLRAVDKLDGDAGFAEVFFDDVFVADADVLGEVDKGWNVAMATTGSERGLTLRSPGRFGAVVERLIELFRRRERAGLVDDARLRDEVADCWMQAEAYRLATNMTVTRLSAGGRAGAESSLNKVWWSQMDIHLHDTALRLLGPDADLEGPWMKGFEFALAGPIYAGTNEVQRNVIAERLLGLPRA